MVRSDRARYLPPAFLLLVATFMAWSFFGDEDGQEVPAAGVGAVEALCAATEAAADGDSDAASAIFADRAHEPLHNLAAAVAERDRGVAGRLLETKQGVEARLEQGRPTTFDELIAAAREAAGVVGADPGGC